MNKKLSFLPILSELFVILSFVFVLVYYSLNQDSSFSLGFPAFDALAIMTLLLVSIIGIFNKERKMFFIGCTVAPLTSLINFIYIMSESSCSGNNMLNTMVSVFFFALGVGIILSSISGLTSIKKGKKHLFVYTATPIAIFFLLGFSILSVVNINMTVSQKIIDGEAIANGSAYYVAYIVFFSLAILVSILAPAIQCYLEDHEEKEPEVIE